MLATKDALQSQPCWSHETEGSWCLLLFSRRILSSLVGHFSRTEALLENEWEILPRLSEHSSLRLHERWLSDELAMIFLLLWQDSVQIYDLSGLVCSSSSEEKKRTHIFRKTNDPIGFTTSIRRLATSMMTLRSQVEKIILQERQP